MKFPHLCIGHLLVLILLMTASVKEDRHDLLISLAAAQPSEVKLARPTPEQAAWQDLELGLFIHYDMPVFKPGWNHRQYEQRPEPRLFNPKKLDTDQWMEAAKAMGAKYAVFVAKHGSGFMCWQSDLYPYGMKQSPYKNGQGDLVRDFVNSCRKYGIKPGLYAHMGCNGYLEVDNPGLVNRGKGGDPEKQARYAKICEGMLTELWGNYGELMEIWFDGGVLDPAKGGPEMLPILRKLQPKAIVFQGAAASIRWIGNEDGVAPYPCWATVPEGRDYNGPGSPDGQKWLPGECDVPIRQGIWLWEPNTEGRLFSVNQLMDRYYRSVGHNCNLLLNANPDPDGLIPQPDMNRYKEFGDEVRRRFGRSIAETAGCGDVVELALPKPARIDHVIAMENILEGERVREYVIEGRVGEQWKELCRGTSIGHKKIDRFSPTDVSKIRWRCLKSIAEPRIRKLAAYVEKESENAASVAADQSRVLPSGSFKHYIEAFNRSDRETVLNHIPNATAWEWMSQNVPLLDCPDKDIEEIYYFRWWTYRKHLKQTPGGFVVTEFLPQVGWSKKYNTINCPAGHHLYEGRWIHDPRFLDDYARFYLGKGGDPGGVSKVYSNWLTDGIYARYLVNADKSFLTGLLDELVKNHEEWGCDGTPGDAFQKSRRLDSGLYWQIDSWEGGEYSIGGTGIRPMINSYMYGSAAAISHIAELAGRRELADHYRAEAEQLRKLVQGQLWDPEAKFFKVMRHEKAPTNQYGNPAAESCEPGQRVKVREIFGYVPWYFNLPEGGRGYEEAWRELTDPQGFHAPYGPTVAERRHPNFKVNDVGCQWCGASWPFSTAQTLTALANLLNNYQQNVVDKKQYFDTLRLYTRSHRRRLNNGVTVPWIDESLNPDTGAWIATEGDPPRGKDYNHSTYCDLVISGLVGLRPRADNTIEVNPLVPEGTWDYFCLDQVRYHGRLITILYDKTGERYGKGQGLQVQVDGRCVARGDLLQRVTGKLPK